MQKLEREIASTAAYLTKLRRQRRDMEIAAGKNERAKSPRILAIRLAYVGKQVTVADIAERFGTSAGFVQKLARELDWPRRSPPACVGQQIRRHREVA